MTRTGARLNHAQNLPPGHSAFALRRCFDEPVMSVFRKRNRDEESGTGPYRRESGTVEARI